ncbi:MAG: hypothetical protein L6R35_006714 [Caloplaca aegaea]|nr:MAG: hypothetical protein L6R35_006714 [Caloplaca aegaea]
MRNIRPSIFLSVCIHTLLVMSHVTTGRDGHGLIGYGISMYKPLCAYVCRDLLSTSMLNCSETMDMSGGMSMHMHGAGETSPDCYATDDAFLGTLAYCMSTHCQGTAIYELERYWSLNVAGRQPEQPLPKASYQETLAGITLEPMETLVVGEELNQTMLVSEEDYEMSHNAQAIFEKMEVNHETYGIVLIVTGAAIPIACSLLRFIPFPATKVTKFNAWFIDPPVFGSRHKTPIAGLFHMPTRGQAFFIVYLVAINVILSAAGIESEQPNSWFPSASGSSGEILAYFSNRVGVLSFANMPLLFLYAGRNNVLLWLTSWSHGTFLLLHRWVAAIATLQAILHSAIYLHIYIHNGEHTSESQMTYWIWGIIATLSMTILLPTSLLPLRKRAYEFFLAWHVLLSIFVLAGSLWHILARFSRQWGYENWIYIAIAIWGFERAMRLARLARNGVKVAKVTIIDDDYVSVHVEGVTGSGHAYLYFPTLTWRVWENHPFSVASAVLPPSSSASSSSGAEVMDLEKRGDGDNRFSSSSSSDSNSNSASKPHFSSSSSSSSPPSRIGLTFLLRTKAGVTKALRAHASLPVLVESGYGPPHTDLSSYPLLICIAGGVGITACVPYLRAHPGEAKLFWGARSQGVVDAIMAGSLLQGGGVQTETFVGKRMSIRQVLGKELSAAAAGGGGEAVVLVSGPSEMADEVRGVVGELGRKRGGEGIKVKLLEEAFSW